MSNYYKRSYYMGVSAEWYTHHMEGRYEIMRIKEYKYIKTAKKMATENNLVQTKQGKITLLFDFSLLDSISVTEIEKDGIIQDALKYVTPGNRTSFYGTAIDNFTRYDGIADYCYHKVFCSNGKLLYGIMQLMSIEHHSKNRTSIYDNYTAESYTLNSDYDLPINDIEIA